MHGCFHISSILCQVYKNESTRWAVLENKSQIVFCVYLLINWKWVCRYRSNKWKCFSIYYWPFKYPHDNTMNSLHRRILHNKLYSDAIKQYLHGTWIEFVPIHHHLKASKHKRTTSIESKGLLLMLKLLSEMLQNTEEQLICSLLNTTKLQMLSTAAMWKPNVAQAIWSQSLLGFIMWWSYFSVYCKWERTTVVATRQKQYSVYAPRQQTAWLAGWMMWDADGI